MKMSNQSLLDHIKEHEDYCSLFKTLLRESKKITGAVLKIQPTDNVVVLMKDILTPVKALVDAAECHEKILRQHAIKLKHKTITAEIL